MTINQVRELRKAWVEYGKKLDSLEIQLGIKRRTYKGWTPEARAKQGEQMRKAWAKRKAKAGRDLE